MQKKISMPICLLIVLHFVFIIFGAFNIQPFQEVKLKKMFDLYGHLTGASADYTYFAQELPPEMRIRVEFIFMDGGKKNELLGESYSREIQMIQGKYMQKFHFNKDLVPEYLGRREKRIEILGQALIKKYENIKSINLYFDSFNPVNIVDYRKGLRSEWINIASRSISYDK